MEKFISAISCGVEDWNSNERYRDIAMDIYNASTPHERDALKVKVFEQYGKDISLPLLRLYEIICQCAASEDVDYLRNEIRTSSTSRVVFLAELIIESPIVCRELLECLYPRIMNGKLNAADYSVKKSVEIAYRLCFPFEMGEVNDEKSEAIFSLTSNTIDEILFKIKRHNVNSIYIFDLGQYVEGMREVFDYCQESLIFVGVDSNLVLQLFQMFTKVSYTHFAHYEKPILYILK